MREEYLVEFLESGHHRGPRLHSRSDEFTDQVFGPLAGDAAYLWDRVLREADG